MSDSDPYLANRKEKKEPEVQGIDIDHPLLETASLPRALTLGKGFAEGGPQQRALGEF